MDLKSKYQKIKYKRDSIKKISQRHKQSTPSAGGSKNQHMKTGNMRNTTELNSITFEFLPYQRELIR